MNYQADNAIIMAAGASSRFAPLSFERPKGLISVRGEVLIERQIRQLHEAGISEVVVVTGYKSECFVYLKEKYGVVLVHNPSYNTRNNNSSIYAAREYLHNSYLCSSDNYFSENPFEPQVDGSYYCTVFEDGPTEEWCVDVDAQGNISHVQIGGSHAWYMLGHTFWDEDFSRQFLEILDREYDAPETADKLWEHIYISHLDELKMKARHYDRSQIFEFDTLDELRLFDTSYWDNTRSSILKKIAHQLNCGERDLTGIKAIKGADASACGFCFTAKGASYEYRYQDQKLQKVQER